MVLIKSPKFGALLLEQKKTVTNVIEAHVQRKINV